MLSDLIIGAVISAVSSILLKSTVLNSAQRINQYINTINMLRADIVSLKADSAKTNAQLQELQLRLFEKDKQVVLLENTAWESPFPYWLKDLTGKYIYTNKAFSTIFNLDMSEVLNKTDVDIYGQEKGTRYYSTDKDLLKSTDSYIIYYEPDLPDFVCTKWKRCAGTALIGTAGQVIPLDKNKKLYS